MINRMNNTTIKTKLLPPPYPDIAITTFGLMWRKNNFRSLYIVFWTSMAWTIIHFYEISQIFYKIIYYFQINLSIINACPIIFFLFTYFMNERWEISLQSQRLTKAHHSTPPEKCIFIRYASLLTHQLPCKDKKA